MSIDIPVPDNVPLGTRELLATISHYSQAATDERIESLNKVALEIEHAYMVGKPLEDALIVLGILFKTAEKVLKNESLSYEGEAPPPEKVSSKQALRIVDRIKL
jgi:hypothetical protein